MRCRPWLPGADCWAPDAESAFIEAKVVEVKDTGQVVVSVGGTTRPEPISEDGLLPRAPGQRCAPEMDDLQALNMASVLANVEMLFGMVQSDIPGDGANVIYSSVGPILIAMNPFQQLPLYGPYWIRAYSQQLPGTARLPPHCYRTAQEAFLKMQAFRRPQACVVCGESGAGKTVTNMKMLQYLCEVGKRKEGQRAGVDPQQIVKASELLEAFGNAMTGRNFNSSRFGRFTKLSFDESGTNWLVSGCSVDHYLLERSRVASPPKGERNYHIFYMLARSSEAVSLGLGEGPQAFAITTEGADKEVADFNRPEDFARLAGSMEDAGMNESFQRFIFECVAAVMHLGNIAFVGNQDQSSVEPSTHHALEIACTLLGLDAKAFQNALCVSFMTTPGGGQIKKNLSLEQANAQRDAVAKTLYAKLFDMIMWRINRKLCGYRRSSSLARISLHDQSKDKGKDHVMGLLDIFGFEDMPVNGFEQMFINLTNERIQLLFNQVMFQREADEYLAQGVPASVIESLDCVTLLSSSLDAVRLFNSVRPPGIVKLLTDQCNLPSGKDGDAFVNVLKANVHELPGAKFRVCSPQGLRKVLVEKGYTSREIRDMDYQKCFHVQHYAGSVMYTVEDFLPKSRDGLLSHLTEVMRRSTKPDVVDLFPEQSSKKKTIGSHFCEQLEVLAEQLERGDTLFVRCIKSNLQQAPGSINKKLVLEQLVRGGLVAALEMRQAGFPDRVEYEEFYLEFRCLEPGKTSSSVQDLKLWCQDLLKMFLDESGAELSKFNVGKTKLLMKGDVLPFMRSLVIFKSTWFARRLQGFWRQKKRTQRLREVDEAWAKLQDLESTALHIKHLQSVASLFADAANRVGPVRKVMEEARRGCHNDLEQILVALDAHAAEIPQFQGVLRQLEATVERVNARRQEACQLLAARVTWAAKQVAVLLDRLQEVEEACAETEAEGREDDRAGTDSCKAACKAARQRIEQIQKSELPDLKKLGPTTFDLEGSEPFDATVDPSPAAAQFVEEVISLVEKAEQMGMKLGASRRRFAEVVREAVVEREEARGVLESLQEATRCCIREGLDGIAENVNLSWKRFEEAEEILHAARDENQFRAAVRDFLEAVSDAKKAVEDGQALLEKREREREERTYLRQQIDNMESELRTTHQSLGDGLELTLAGDAEAKRVYRDLAWLLQELPTLRERANDELEDFRTAIKSFAETSNASINEGSSIWAAAQRRRRETFHMRKAMFQGGGQRNSIKETILEPDAFIEQEGATRHRTNLQNMASIIASLRDGGLSKATTQRCASHFIKYSYDVLSLSPPDRD